MMLSFLLALKVFVCWLYPMQAIQYHVLFVYHAYIAFRDPREHTVTFGRFLAETTFVESFQTMLRYGVREEVYNEETDDNRGLRSNLFNAMSVRKLI